MIPKSFAYLLKYYSLFGFYSISSMGIGKKHVNSLIQIGLCMWCTFNTITTFIEAQAVLKYLDALNMLLYFVVSISAYWLIIYDSCARRSIQDAFWPNFTKIDKQFSLKNEEKIWIYLIDLIIPITFDIVISILSFSSETLSSTNHRIMHFFLIYIIDHAITFYVLHLKVFTFQLAQIELKLQKEQINEVQLKWLRHNFQMIFEMSEHLNEIFGWSNLALILFSTLSFVAHLNLIYRIICGEHKRFNHG